MSKLKPLLFIILILLGTFNYLYAEVVTMKVSASAYNSTVEQTNSAPFIGAWGDRLMPGVKSIAVSRDLLKRGLTHNSVVKIEGFDGEYIVKDKMNKRWKNKIDIYMGLDKKAAKDWGIRKVTITFNKK